jgi:ribonucleoside-diphosphate reductase alpha chain
MSQEDLNERVKVAAFIATLQSSYTDFHFLREIWKKQTEKEALIGVSLTGIADGEILKYNLSEAAEIVKYENKRVAEIIHINPAYRTCTVKPSGNSSVVLRTSSGIHPRYSKYYYRRMRINKTESIYTYFKINAEELLEDDIRDTNLGIIKVPIKSPENSIFRNEDCISFLERIKKVYSEWIGPGHIKGANTNNVSATLSIKDEDWEKVGEWMWNNRSFYNGITVLPYDGGSYVQMPYEECTEKDYLDFIEKIKDVKIDFKDITEFEDLTDLQGEVACGGGGSCEIK